MNNNFYLSSVPVQNGNIHSESCDKKSETIKNTEQNS
jgi:hypothetical protein